MPWRAGERVVESMPVGFMSVDQDWVITHVNPAGERLVMGSREELVGREYWSVYPENVDSDFGRTFRKVAETGESALVEAFYPHPLNRWYEVEAVKASDGLMLYFTDVTERRVAQERLAMLARVSAELAGTLDAGIGMSRIPRLLVPAIGDWCVLTVVDDGGRPADVGWWHADPARRSLVERYAAVRLDAMPVSSPVVQALMGETVVSASADVVDLLPPGEARELALLLGVTSGVTLPLRGRGRTLGVLTLYFDGLRTPSAAELTTGREVADRVGLALDNARLFTEQRKLAEELQRSLLTGPVQFDRAEVVVRYTPAAVAARVGGDWYDAFLQPSGSMMVVIGDVVGHDTAAAADMGQLRALLRGIATYSDAGPGEVLRGLDASMAQLQLATYATAAVARFEQTPAEAARAVTRMRWTNAGHLPPLVIHPDGTLAALAEWKGELLLGVDASVRREESVVTLDEGTTVLLFTDGLIERRDADLDEGMSRLREAAAELAGAPLDVLCDELVDRLVHGQPEDDVALVAVRLRR
ncbi:MAG: uncharacterized protein JWR62_3043 [Modestobacter sp.]|nr:uncharacterized protein [Modestobacter sp.]